MSYQKILTALRNTSSRNEKTKIIAQAMHSEYTFDKVLKYAYHPFKQYGLRQVPWKGKGDLFLNDTAWEYVLDKLASGILSGSTAKIEVQNFMEALRPEEAELFKQILKKDLRAGISAKTINLAYGHDVIPIFGAMLAKTYKGGIVGPVYMSLKLDGLRAIFKNNTLYTRNGHIIHGVEHITDCLKEGGFTSLDGELMIPGMNFQESSGLIRSYNKCPSAIYHVFDTPDIPGTFTARWTDLKDAKEHLKNISDNKVQVVNHVLTKSEQKIAETFGKALDAGYEGLVLKTPHHKYQAKRSADWLKLKAVRSEDLPIVGFFEGTGKYEGSLGGVIVERPNGVHVKVGGGFSDGERDDIWNNPEKYLGVISEVLFHEETPDGSLRHPRNKILRIDK